VRIKRRLEALEKLLISAPVTLFFEDGSSAQINGHGDYLLNLFVAAVRGERSSETDLIARSVRPEEPDGSHMLELMRALLNGPAAA